jgi:hypothetical protein
MSLMTKRPQVNVNGCGTGAYYGRNRQRRYITGQPNGKRWFDGTDRGKLYRGHGHTHARVRGDGLREHFACSRQEACARANPHSQ